jgi:hypothetical protein
MVETISPAVHGGRNLRYWNTLALHTAGSSMSAIVVGLALGGLGRVLAAPWGRSRFFGLAVVAAAYALREAGVLPLPLPSLKRQVPDWWRTFFSPPVAATLYGLGLGAGVLTFLSFGTYAAVVSAAVVSGDPLVVGLICAPFGIARGLSMSVAAAPGDRSAVDRIEDIGATPWPRVANGVALSMIAVASMAAAL